MLKGLWMIKMIICKMCGVMLLQAFYSLFDGAKVIIISHIALFFLRFFLLVRRSFSIFDMHQAEYNEALLNERKYILLVHQDEVFLLP